VPQLPGVQSRRPGVLGASRVPGMGRDGGDGTGRQHDDDESVRQAEGSARTSTAGSEGGFVAYLLTPNMWEWPWIRKLLSELPVSRCETRDLWSPPPARARVRRLQIRLELLLPGPLRPTRRRLRPVVRPEGPSVFVYNTWGLDPMVRMELANLLSGLADVGVVSVDEPMRDSAQTYARMSFVVRVGFGDAQYRDAQNVLVAPLGVPSNFVPSESRKSLRERSFSWAFLGELKNESRRQMVRHLEAVRGERYLHATSAWESEDALGGEQYSDILADTVFAPSPPANVHVECYRTYEALACGAIPVVDTDYYRSEFAAPFPVVRSDWSDASEILNSFLDHTPALEQLDEQTRRWWSDAKQGYPEKIRSLARGSLLPPRR
jgi:hypothetical protein